jgi:1,2-diacylglycerol 3-alpha-glucosyltransferase
MPQPGAIARIISTRFRNIIEGCPQSHLGGMNMNYAEFNDSYPPLTDGVAQTMRNYTLWLNRKPNTTCCAVTPQHPQADDHEEFPVYRFASMPLFLVKDYQLGLPEIAFKTYHKLDTLPLDLVHTHCPFASGTLALMIARKKNIPLVATFHSKFADDFAQRMKMENAGKIAAMYTAKFFAQADEVWAVNKSTGKTLEEYGYRGPITVMPNGCDFAPRIRTAENRRKVLDHFGLSDKPLLLFVGRIVEQKNIAFLLKSLCELKKTAEFNMLLVGDGESMPAYRKQVVELGIADRVKFAGTVQDREFLRDIYAAADLFVLPSIYDNAPLVVREAASCGCASALIEGSNSAEGIINGVNGFTSILDTSAYAAMLGGVLANPGLLIASGESARETVYISWEKIVDKASTEYQRIITEYNGKKAAAKRRRYYSVPTIIAKDIIDRQTVRIKFTAKNVNRQSRHRSNELTQKNVKRLKELRSRLLETKRRRDL